MALKAATLEIDGLTAGYDRAAVVRDLSLMVAPGEVVALLGANGAGKTTTLRAISGLLKPMAGRIRLDGAELGGVSATARAHRGIVHVPHDRGIFFGLTVAEHFRLDGVTQDDEQAAAFEHFPVLHKLRSRRAGLLSGGEQQMLALARALARKPRLLLLDELSLGLAPIIVERLLPVVREFAAKDRHRGPAGRATRTPCSRDRGSWLCALPRRARGDRHRRAAARGQRAAGHQLPGRAGALSRTPDLPWAR